MTEDKSFKIHNAGSTRCARCGLAFGQGNTAYWRSWGVKRVIVCYSCQIMADVGEPDYNVQRIVKGEKIITGHPAFLESMKEYLQQQETFLWQLEGKMLTLMNRVKTLETKLHGITTAIQKNTPIPQDNSH